MPGFKDPGGKVVKFERMLFRKWILLTSLILVDIFIRASKRNADQELPFDNRFKRPRLGVPNSLANEGSQTASSSSSSSQASGQSAAIIKEASAWDFIRKNLIEITLDGQDVAVGLREKGNFFLDLPFLDCVLPSMQAGEPYFVPAFIQNVLFPYWRYGKDHFQHNERSIVAVSGKFLYPSMAEYLELLFLAAVLETDQPEDALKMVKSGNLSRLEELTLWCFDIRLSNLFADADFKSASLHQIMPKQKRIPALLMIGHQWGFNAQKIALKIIKTRSLCRDWMEENDNLVWLLVNAVACEAVLPCLKEAKICWIAWTINPEFEFGLSEVKGKMQISHKIRFQSKSDSSSFIKPRSSSYQEILSALEAMEIKRDQNYAPLTSAADASDGNRAGSHSSSSSTARLPMSSRSGIGTDTSVKTRATVARPLPLPVFPNETTPHYRNLVKKHLNERANPVHNQPRPSKHHFPKPAEVVQAEVLSSSRSAFSPSPSNHQGVGLLSMQPILSSSSSDCHCAHTLSRSRLSEIVAVEPRADLPLLTPTSFSSDLQLPHTTSTDGVSVMTVVGPLVETNGKRKIVEEFVSVESPIYEPSLFSPMDEDFDYLPDLNAEWMGFESVMFGSLPDFELAS